MTVTWLEQFQCSIFKLPTVVFAFYSVSNILKNRDTCLVGAALSEQIAEPNSI